MRMVLCFLLLPLLSFAQRLDLKTLDALRAKASDTVDVNLEGPLLQLAAKFLSSRDPDEAKIKKLVAGLAGVYVKSFEFEKKDRYSETDLNEVRAQLKAPGWSKVASIRSTKDGENAEIFLRSGAKDQVGGLTIISAEPKELSIVQILGAISLGDLRDLAGNFGIPETLKKEMK